jgi:hypothetical protein
MPGVFEQQRRFLRANARATIEHDFVVGLWLFKAKRLEKRLGIHRQRSFDVVNYDRTYQK